MSQRDTEVRERIQANDVTIFRSYLEVDVADWFSANEIPYAYEQFTIPSVAGPSKDRWDNMVESVRARGNLERVGFESVDGRVWSNRDGEYIEKDEWSSEDILETWTSIFQKHRLGQEDIEIPPLDAMAGFSKTLILPDFSLYLDSQGLVSRQGGVIASEDFDWTQWDYIVEVSGLWGVGLPGEPTEEDWWDWYRVSAVAFKEFAYKLLGLWDRVVWVIPNQPFIEGVSDGIPNSLRNDDNYVVMKTTSSEVKLQKLSDRTGLSTGTIETGMSPAITPTEYKRPDANQLPEEIQPVEYTFDGINFDNVGNDERAVPLEDDWLVYHGELGEVFINGDTAHVKESQWRGQNMILVREYVLETLNRLSVRDILEGFRQANEP
jgi:hypothetical protein